MTAKTMAEIIKDAIEFTPYWVNGGLNQDPYENAVKALTAAGFGLVADAKAEALRQAQEVAWAKGATAGGVNLMALQSAGINPNPYREARRDDQ